MGMGLEAQHIGADLEQIGDAPDAAHQAPAKKKKKKKKKKPVQNHNAAEEEMMLQQQPEVLPGDEAQLQAELEEQERKLAEIEAKKRHLIEEEKRLHEQEIA